MTIKSKTTLYSLAFPVTCYPAVNCERGSQNYEYDLQCNSFSVDEKVNAPDIIKKGDVLKTSCFEKKGNEIYIEYQKNGKKFFLFYIDEKDFLKYFDVIQQPRTNNPGLNK